MVSSTSSSAMEDARKIVSVDITRIFIISSSSKD